MVNLAKIQSLIKAPKGQFNSFGKYKYRSCEDILEAVKPIINPLGYFIRLTDNIEEIGGRIYVVSEAILSNGVDTYTCVGYAREEETKKGMDGSQITGSSSSYARKYALCGLFALDDNKDSDTTNVSNDEPTQDEKYLLHKLVNTSDLTEEEMEKARKSIDTCSDYDTYQKIQYRLEDRQLPFDQIPNPNQKDISKHVKKLSK